MQKWFKQAYEIHKAQHKCKAHKRQKSKNIKQHHKMKSKQKCVSLFLNMSHKRKPIIQQIKQLCIPVKMKAWHQITFLPVLASGEELQIWSQKLCLLSKVPEERKKFRASTKGRRKGQEVKRKLTFFGAWYTGDTANSY